MCYEALLTLNALMGFCNNVMLEFYRGSANPMTHSLYQPVQLEKEMCYVSSSFIMFT